MCPENARLSRQRAGHEMFREMFKAHFPAGLRSVSRAGSQYSAARSMVNLKDVC